MTLATALFVMSTPAAPVTKLAGVEWQTSLAAATRKAEATGKPILHLQMFGRLDDAYC